MRLNDLELIEKISLELRVKFEKIEDAEIVYNSILPELNFSPNERSQVSLSLSENYLILKINSADFIILRAIINSYLRWFNTSENIIRIIKE
jgi:KEOPS complex subunit Pcc1